MKTNKLVAAFLITILFWLSGQSLYAWSYHTHRKITADALNIMPRAFQQRFRMHKKSFLKGATDPDTMIKDFSNHAYHPDQSHTAGYYRLDELFEKAISLIQKDEDDAKIAYLLGLMSHYVADFNQPLHTAGSERDPNEKLYHSRYERDLNSELSQMEPKDFNFNPVTNVKNRLMKMTNTANSRYGEIQSAYTSGDGLSQTMKLTKTQYAEATRNLADFWMGAFQLAGRPISNFNSGSSKSYSSSPSYQKPTKSKININKASERELMDFLKISEAKARAIVNNRPYRRIYDLAKVRGFNVYYVKRNKSKLKVR